MPRRSNSFARALKDAEKRLEKAWTERMEAQSKLIALDAEIPQLQHIIASLNPDAKLPTFTHQSIPGVINEVMATLPDGSDLSTLVGPQDLSGMGSIPPKMPTEDDLLPDDFAEGKKE